MLLGLALGQPVMSNSSNKKAGQALRGNRRKPEWKCGQVPVAACSCPYEFHIGRTDYFIFRWALRIPEF